MVELLVEGRGRALCVTLNRPQALNALTHCMVHELDRALDHAEADPAIKAVVVRGAGGKAFSAGGDIRALHDLIRGGHRADALSFWRDEYQLNKRIKSFPKAYVCLVDGIVMGGGVGVSLNGSHRIAGEGFAFAMPEVGIGFFPDVGATFFLPRLPGRLGTLLALTGERVKTADAVASGLADAFVPAARHDDLVAALADGEPVEPVVARLTAAAGDGPLMAARATIDRLFAGDTVESVLASLDTDTGDLPTRWAAAIRTKSPTSLKIALRQMQTGGRQTFAEAMRTEFRIVSRLIDGHDFTEGVRALIIDKDYRPAWQPATLAAVDDGEIDRHVAPLGADELPD